MKYRITFTEVVTYVVDIETDKPVNYDNWFEIMDEANPDWLKEGPASVTERDLDGIEKIAEEDVS